MKLCVDRLAIYDDILEELVAIPTVLVLTFEVFSDVFSEFVLMSAMFVDMVSEFELIPAIFNEIAFS